MTEPGGTEVMEKTILKNNITSEAEKIVNISIPLITDKNIVAPSGD